MVLVSRVRRALGWVLVGGAICAGCGESNDTGPAPEPSVGPAAPAGGEKGPSFTPTGKTDKAAPEKAAETK